MVFLVLGAALPIAAYAGQYDDFAVISSTMGVSGNRVCIGESTRGDIGCPTWAPYVSSNGTVSATKFVGDGSGLTGISSGASSIDALSDAAANTVSQSVYLGQYSGASVTTGTSNTAVGMNALASNTTYSEMVSIGTNAMKAGSRGDRNTAVGSSAMYVGRARNDNTAVGAYALYSTMASSNVAVGSNALYISDIGGFNVAVGADAAKNGLYSYYNTALGYRALYNGGYGNVAIGYQSGGANGTVGYLSSNNTVVGAYAGQMLGPVGTIYPISNTLIGYNAGGAITSGQNNIVIGSNISPYSNTGNNQLNLGNVLFGDLGGGSTLQGKLGINVTSPTNSLDVSGTVNASSFFTKGSTSGYYFLDRSSNNFSALYRISGTSRLWDDVGGDRVTVNNTTGYVGIGTTTPGGPLEVYTAGTVAGTIDGLIRMNAPASTYRFTRYLTAGSARWDMGTDSAAETGSNAGSNFFLNRFNDSGTYIDTILWANRSTGDLNINNRLYVGGNLAMNTNGAVIQAKDPGGNYRNVLYGRWTDDGTYIDGGTGLYLRTNNGGTTALSINSSGYVGIGTGSPGYLIPGLAPQRVGINADTTADAFGIKYDGSGNIMNIWRNNSSVGNGVMMNFMFGNGTAPSVGTITTNGSSIAYNTTSDRRLKTDIRETARGLDDLMKVQVRDFRFKADPSKTMVQGFIAQDLYQVYPEAVTVGGEDASKHPWNVDYGRMTPLVVKSIQDLKARNDHLEARVAELRAANDNLRTENEKLRADNAQVKIRLERIEALLDGRPVGKETPLLRRNPETGRLQVGR